MKMTVITSCNDDVLRGCLSRLRWSQLDLAYRSRVKINSIREIVNLGRAPTRREANAIQKAFGKAGEYIDVLELWPATFAVRKHAYCGQSYSEIQFESIQDHPDVMEFPEPGYENEGLEGTMETVLSDLPKRMYEILKLRYWNGERHERVGDLLGISRSRVQQIEQDAFRTLKEPVWARKLGAYLPRHLRPRNFILRQNRRPKGVTHRRTHKNAAINHRVLPWVPRDFADSSIEPSESRGLNKYGNPSSKEFKAETARLTSGETAQQKNVELGVCGAPLINGREVRNPPSDAGLTLMTFSDFKPSLRS